MFVSGTTSMNSMFNAIMFSNKSFTKTLQQNCRKFDGQIVWSPLSVKKYAIAKATEKLNVGGP